MNEPTELPLFASDEQIEVIAEEMLAEARAEGFNPNPEQLRTMLKLLCATVEVDGRHYRKADLQPGGDWIRLDPCSKQ